MMMNAGLLKGRCSHKSELPRGFSRVISSPSPVTDWDEPVCLWLQFPERHGGGAGENEPDCEGGFAAGGSLFVMSSFVSMIFIHTLFEHAQHIGGNSNPWEMYSHVPGYVFLIVLSANAFRNSVLPIPCLFITPP